MLPRARHSLLVLLGVGAAVAACGGGDGLGPADLGRREVALAGVGGSGITGTASIAPESGGVTSTVEVELRGLAPGVSHMGHIHEGSCAAPGEIDVMLSPVTGDADGRGTATTPGVPNDDLQRGYVVQYHVALDPAGAPIACGDIDGAPGTEVTGGPSY